MFKLIKSNLNSIQLRRKQLCKLLSAQNYSSTKNVSYVQGQSVLPKIREYFYYIDHEGMVMIFFLYNFSSHFYFTLNM